MGTNQQTLTHLQNIKIIIIPKRVHSVINSTEKHMDNLAEMKAEHEFQNKKQIKSQKFYEKIKKQSELDPLDVYQSEVYLNKDSKQSSLIIIVDRRGTECDIVKMYKQKHSLFDK